MELILHPRAVDTGSVTPIENGWRLALGAGGRQHYRLAQVDDYARLGRKNLLHRAPWEFRLRARVSAEALPGTWGFGLWNDPFGFSIGFGGAKKQLPAMPQVAWFFHASRENWLALRESPPGAENAIPPNGFFAGALRSLPIASGWFVPGLPALPLFALRPFSRMVRRVASRRIIQQDGTGVSVPVTEWHEYSIRWMEQECSFGVDGNEVLRTGVSPRGPLGLVLWIDNQFAAWRPDGSIGYGTMENPAAWLEVKDIEAALL